MSGTIVGEAATFVTIDYWEGRAYQRVVHCARDPGAPEDYLALHDPPLVCVRSIRHHPDPPLIPTTEEEARRMNLREELAAVLHRCAMDERSETPELVLAEYIIDCVAAFDKATWLRSRLMAKDGNSPGGE